MKRIQQQQVLRRVAVSVLMLLLMQTCPLKPFSTVRKTGSWISTPAQATQGPAHPAPTTQQQSRQGQAATPLDVQHTPPQTLLRAQQRMRQHQPQRQRVQDRKGLIAACSACGLPWTHAGRVLPAAVPRRRQLGCAGAWAAVLQLGGCEQANVWVAGAHAAGRAGEEERVCLLLATHATEEFDNSVMNREAAT